MSLHVLEREQFVPTALHDLFPFFAEPENLRVLTPPSMHFEILTPAPLVMKPGALIDYRIRFGRLPLRWRTLITAYEPPHRFVDEQLRGPYDLWHHTHTFTERNGGTLIHDRVVYALPFGPLGDLIHSLLVRGRLDAVFDYRRREVARRFGESQ